MTQKVKLNREQPKCPESGYSFVAAGALYKRFGNYCVYIKYKGGPSTIKVKQEGKRHIWFQCPDREILIVRGSQETGAFYPSGESFDEVYDFNLFKDEVAKAAGLEYIMTNFAHSQDYKCVRYPTSLPPEKRIQVLSDSGGLQLARGVRDIIHPLELIEYYNNNVDAGMILDVPLALFNNRDPKTVKRAALLQKRNTDIMVENSKGVELINITHGNTLEQRSMFREIVEDPRVPRIAIAALDSQSLLTAVNTIYNTVNGSSMRYKQYHALGIFRAPLLPIFVKIANTGDNPPHITSDSTSHIQSAVNKAMHFQFDMFHTSKRLPIGSRNSVKNSSRMLPCQCPVCVTIKYTDILGFGRGRLTDDLLAIHNASEMARYCRGLQEACRELPRTEFRNLIIAQLKYKDELREVLMAFDFIDMANDTTLAKARKKYEHHLNTWKYKGKPTPPPGLFGAREQVGDLDDQKKKLDELLTRMEKQIK